MHETVPSSCECDQYFVLLLPVRTYEGLCPDSGDRTAKVSVPHAGGKSALRLRVVESYLSALLRTANLSGPLAIALLKRMRIHICLFLHELTSHYILAT